MNAISFVEPDMYEHKNTKNSILDALHPPTYLHGLRIFIPDNPCEKSENSHNLTWIAPKIGFIQLRFGECVLDIYRL